MAKDTVRYQTPGNVDNSEIEGNGSQVDKGVGHVVGMGASSVQEIIGWQGEGKSPSLDSPSQ